MIAALDKFAVRGANSGGAKDDSMVNSLGMKLVPVPGTAVLFCIHPTRKGDYRVFADAIGKIDNSWRNPNDILTDPITRERTQVPVSERDDHPVVSVSWNDAKAFCEWLSKKEGRKYRLPTDHEWSCAVGIGNRDLRDWEPALKDRTDKVPGVFPWGTAWPPPLWAGNFADSQYAAKFPTRVIPADSRSEPAFIRDYHDGFATTSPVGSFAPNALSLYDMAGNVAQWCEDWWDHTHSGRVVRGSSWLSFEEDVLLSAHHDWSAPDNRSNYRGFRIVVEK
jgi:formylglycine-generating enzyme required for sulfatase activity